MRRRLFLFLLVVVLALIGATPATTYSSYSSPLSLNSVATWLAMRPVTIRCLTQEEADADYVITVQGAEAYVEGTVDGWGRWHPYDYAVFNYGVCQPLEALMAGQAGYYPVEDIAWSILVLTHESGHLRGWSWAGDEARTECWAIRHVGYVAFRLGVVDPVARRTLVMEAVSFHKAMSPEYQLPTCRLPGT